MLAELLFQAAWVAAFLLPGAQGRVYSARKKLANFAVERRRIGPHVCLSGFGNGCCPGWMPSPGSGLCTLPLCSFGCGSGFCIAPNVCSCRDGGQGVTCQDPPGACGEYGCDLACNHGGCQEVSRVCPLGFSMTETVSGVRCVDIDECLSASCEGLCVNTEGGFVCECGLGMQLAADRHSCQDTDECLATPCQQHCKNSIGSYQCSCHTGFYLHGNQHSCVDVNECRRPSEKRTCHHSCHNTLGSFLCTCHPGYRLSVDRVSCEGFSKSILAPSPILQSLQQPPTLLRLSPNPMAPLLHPRVSPPSPALAPSRDLRTPPPFPLLSTLPTFPPAASPTSVSPPRSSSFGTPFLLRTAGPSVLASSLPPSLLWKEVTPPRPPGPSSPPVSPSALPSACWHEGVLHENSSYWTESPCLNCSCEGGQVFCQAVTCEVSCSHPIPPAQGECCPSCTGCFYYGMSRVEGDVFSLSEKNCTVCTCLAGNISCISPECSSSPCPDSAQTDCCPCQPAECFFHGQTYAEGTEFNLDSDDCTTCVCRQGEVECSFTPCPTLECPRENWLLAPGQCCFTCRRTAVTTGCFVDDNGIEFPVGQLWSPGDPCELCICQADGSVSCKRTDCLEMCPHPVRIPGQCCPDCSAGCTYAGKIFHNNETFPSVLDPCLSCICLLGSVACSPMDCVVFCTYPFHPEGECCPVCHDCNYKGRKVINGHNFVPEDEPCVHCTCQLGEVNCVKTSCASTCTGPFDLSTHCCPDCQGSEVIDNLASLKNRLVNPVMEDGAIEMPLQTLQRDPTTPGADSHCSYCSPTPRVASLTPEGHFEGRNANDQGTSPMNPASLGIVGLYQTRLGEAIKLHLNKPPNVTPTSWLGHSSVPPIKPEFSMPLLSKPVSFGAPPGRSTGSPLTHSSLSPPPSKTSGTSASPTVAYSSISPTPANLRNSIRVLFQHSKRPHSFPLPPPVDTFSPSVSPNLDSPQEHPRGPTHTTLSSFDHQTVEESSKLTSNDENGLTGISL